MAEQVKLKIVKIGRKQNPSKYKPGETYTITTIMDEQNRKITAMGKWTDAWNEGMVVEGILEPTTWTDKDGFEQKGWSLKNPNPVQFKAGGAGYQPKTMVVNAYTIAAQLAPLLFAAKKKVTLDDISALADALKVKMDGTQDTSAKEEVKTVDVNKEKPKSKPTPAAKEETVEDDDDDDMPF